MGVTEQEFLTELYKTNFKKLYSYVHNACAKRGVSNDHSAELSQEVVQDTLHTAAENIQLLIDHPKPDAWLMLVCRHKLQEHARRLKNDQRRLLLMDTLVDAFPELPSHAPSPWEEAEYSASLELVRSSLSEEDFLLFDMVALQNMSHLTAAKALGISVWNSQKRLSRIRKRLQKLFLS